jgi:rubrerythrin
MSERKSNEISRDRLAELLNEDLSREYQAIIAYVVYSQVLKGAEYMDIAAQLEIHAKQELDHALILSRQIDYLGKCRRLVRSRSAHRKMRKTCSATISTMKMKPFAITAIASRSVKRLENMRWPNRFARSSCKSRTIKSIWPLPSVKKFQTSTQVSSDVLCASVANSTC